MKILSRLNSFCKVGFFVWEVDKEGKGSGESSGKVGLAFYVLCWYVMRGGETISTRL